MHHTIEIWHQPNKFSSIWKETYQAILSTGWLIWIYFILFLVDMLVNGLMTSYLVLISNGDGNRNSMHIYAILNAISCIISHISDTWLIRKIECKIQLGFIYKSYKLFDQLDLTSRQKTTTSSFRMMHDGAKFSVSAMSGWGLVSFLDSINTFCVCLYVFYTQGLIYYFVGLSVIITPIGYFIMKVLMNKYTEYNKKSKKERSAAADRIGMIFPRVQERSENADRIIKNAQFIDTECDIRMRKMSLITDIARIPGVLFTFLIVIYVDQIMQFITMLFVISKFCATIINITRFLTSVKRNITDFDTYKEWWDAATFSPPLKQMSLPSMIFITEINVAYPTFKLNNCLPNKILAIPQGTKCLICGKSGGGKTTLITGLAGLIDGCKYSTLSDGIFETYPAGHFVDDIAYCRQMTDPSSIYNLSLADMFEGYSWPVVRQMLELCDLQLTFGYTDKIENRLSGGQRRRLDVALCLCKANNRSCIILDEADANLDENTAVTMINNIKEYFNKKTIFIVSHLNGNGLQKIMPFDIVLNVENGDVSVA